ncbi:MAG: HicB family protein [Snowella sp.]|jgi:predicted RNase H-like HicB family nuclease|nr:MAG: HicB family protein [Snowella sp.]
MIQQISQQFHIEVEQEEDGRWIADIPELPGVMVYGQTQIEAVSLVQALALRVIADKLEQGEIGSNFNSFAFIAA